MPGMRHNVTRQLAETQLNDARGDRNARDRDARHSPYGLRIPTHRETLAQVPAQPAPNSRNYSYHNHKAYTSRDRNWHRARKPRSRSTSSDSKKLVLSVFWRSRLPTSPYIPVTTRCTDGLLVDKSSYRRQPVIVYRGLIIAHCGRRRVCPVMRVVIVIPVVIPAIAMMTSIAPVAIIRKCCARK